MIPEFHLNIFIFRLKQLYRLPIVVKDGRYEITSEVVFNILDVQNTPPIFMGSLTGIVSEDDPVGTQVLTVKARDGDTGQARQIIYTFEENPNNYFAIDSARGEISIDKPIDRETLGPSSGGVLMLRVRASELVNGAPREEDPSTTATADITITIRDVNDEAPLFNKPEYKVTLHENVPLGTPLANLNMEVKDLDTSPNAVFDINLVGGDQNNKFSVEPKRATGHTAVSLKVNSQNLDYENANERKFLLLVEAKEANNGRLSSTATVTVDVLDLNDNSPLFPKDSYTAIVAESAPEGFEVITITAEDRDSGSFGTSGIVYKLSGQGAELFIVDPFSGTITVASCLEDCLDYETVQAYYLSFSATDNNGEGKKTVVSLRISVSDANDNPPKFAQRLYKASINEGEQSFEPQLFVKASDLDESSILRFNIIDGNTNNLFNLNRLTGEINVRQRNGLRLDNIPTDLINLSVEVSDGENTDTARVEINVKDVNDRTPVFEKSVYLSSVPENAPLGTPVENVQATDADYGPNAEIQYKISKGSYDDFAIDSLTGQIVLNGELDYDRRDSYSIEVLAVDGGYPALTGTATLTVSIMNKNNKEPYFFPATQRAQITENSPMGLKIITLNGTDPDVKGQDNLLYEIIEPITAVDKDGAKVSESDGRFKSYFTINETTGEVFVAQELDRSLAAIVSMTVSLTDLSAEPPQVGKGNLVVTIVDVNDFPPAFLEPWTPQRPYLSISVPEEQPKGTIVYTFKATDTDSNIDRFQIISPSRSKRPYEIDSETGDLVITDRIDFEALENKQLTFDLVVYDAGVPQKSAMASVVVNIENLNDESPVFEQPNGYSVALPENSPIGTEIIQVAATDNDEGEFGQVMYEITNPGFSIDPISGILSVVNPDLLDRESNPEITLQIVAKDVAPNSRTTSVSLNITILDENDNPPRFIKKVYAATIVDNIPYYPDPSPIIQLLAEDDDIGKNGQLFFYIIDGNDQGQFFIDNSKGIIYPNTSFVGQQGATYELTVQVYDEGGDVQAWDEPDRAIIAISVENVNTHKPEWFPDPLPDETIELMEEEDISNNVILKVNARDRDRDSENGRVSYHFKVNNQNIGETEEFVIDSETGEVRAKVPFDRELQEIYELVLVARDHGTPVSFETLRFVTVKIKDVNDHDPRFDISDQEDIRFTVPEEEDPGYFVGKVEAYDPDEGKNGRVFYYIIDGNEDKWFSIDKTYGNIYTKQRLDREERDHYVIQVKTTNNPDLVCEGSICDIEPVLDPRGDDSVIMVHIFVDDKNDNLPQFEDKEFFIGIPFDSKIGDLILDAQAHDPDVPDATEQSYANKITYSIRTSNLYRSGSITSSGSLVPSPFEMQQNGRLVLSSLVAEFTQDRFVIEIEAKESLTQHRTRATVNLWIYEPSQLLKLVINMPPMQVNKEKRSIVKALKNVTQDIVVLDDIRYHISPQEGLRRDMTDMYIHVVNEVDNVIVPPEEVVRVVDANYDTLAKVYIDAGIQKIVPSASTEESSSGFIEHLDPNLAALIALLIVLFLGAVLFSILCCCIKNWAFAAAARKASSKQPHKVPPGNFNFKV